jgi:cellulose synthase/poly-beta-1,6-N-acetylglucosamine synthase-like glycosyltransferase
VERFLTICENKKLINQFHLKNIKNPKVSIISPVYNREKYITRLINSIQNQKMDDIEIPLKGHDLLEKKFL